MRVSLIAAGLAATAIAACESYTDVPGSTPYGASLSGADVRPSAVSTQGTGTFIATLHGRNDAVSYTLAWSSLGTTVTAAHLHGPALASATGPELVNFASLPAGSEGTFDAAAGTAAGRLDLTGAITATVSGDSLLTLLTLGQLYVDVHTTGQTGGEIRGQVTRR